MNKPFANGWVVLSRMGKEFEASRDLDLIRLREVLPRSLLHPAIENACLDLFEAGRYQAVFEAFLLVEVAVRDDAGYTQDDYGTDMVSRAFNAKTTSGASVRWTKSPRLRIVA